MGEEYIRVIPLPNFLSKSHGAVPPSPQDARVSLSAARRGLFLPSAV